MKKRKCFKCGYWNKATAEYCGLCYEPFKKSPAGNARTPLRPEKAGNPLTRTLGRTVLAGLLLAAVVSYVQIKNEKAPAHGPRAAARINRFLEKTSEADRLFGEREAARSALLSQIAASPPAPEEFGIAGDYTRRLFDIEAAYAKGIEDLELPARGEVHPKADTPYLEWLSRHKMREAVSVKDFSARYQKLIDAAGVGR